MGAPRERHPRTSPQRGEVDAPRASGEGGRRAANSAPHTLTPPSASTERGVAGKQNLSPYYLQHTGRVFENVVVPESNEPISECFNHLRPGGVDTCRVLTSIQLDANAQRAATEIGHGSANRALPNELRAFEAPPSEIVPEAHFSVGLMTPQLSRDRRQSLLRQRRTPSSQPSPRRGEGAVRHASTSFESTSPVNA